MDLTFTSLLYLESIPITVICAMYGIYVHHDRANRVYSRARRKLIDWQRTRPKLYIAQCPYAQSLVYQMIDAQKRVLWHSFSDVRKEHEKNLAALYAMLTELPPYSGPPEIISGGFLIRKRQRGRRGVRDQDGTR